VFVDARVAEPADALRSEDLDGRIGERLSP
jgi:hypothetical protein